MNEPLSVTISLPEAAKLLGISESLAREMSRAGEFPGAFRLRVRILVHRQVFLEELERLGRGQPLSERDTDRILARATARCPCAADGAAPQWCLSEHFFSY